MRTIVLVVVALGIASVSRAQDYSNVAPTERYYFFGGWVMPPEGPDWKSQRGPRGTDILNFVRGDGYRHTWAASVTTVLFDGPSSRDELVKLARARAVEGQGREVTLRTFEATPDSSLAPNAIRYHYQIEDRKVPYDKGKLYILDARGLLFYHPAAAHRLVTLEYSQRAEASIPLIEDAAADSFLARARLMDTDTTKVRSLDVGYRPYFVRASESAIWVGCERGVESGDRSKQWCEILRLDPASMEIQARGRIDGGVPDFIVGADALWASDERNGRLVRLDPTSLATTGQVKLGGHPWRLLVVGGTVWATDPAGGRIHIVNTATLKPEGKPLKSLKAPYQMLEAGGLVWVTDAKANQVVGIDASSGAASGGSIPVCGQSAAFVFGDSSLWIVCPQTRSVQRLDPVTRSVSATIPLGFIPGTIAFANGAPWVADYNAGRLVRIDPETNQASADGTKVGLDVSRIASNAYGIWAADAIAGKVVMVTVP